MHSPIRGLRHHVALVVDDGVFKCNDIRERVGARSAELGLTRRVVMSEAFTTVEPVITSLASLVAGHPVLLAEPGSVLPGSAARHRTAALVHRFHHDVIAS